MSLLSNRRTRALVLLAVQNSSVSLLTRHSLDRSDYSPAVAVLSTELVKLSISLVLRALETRRLDRGRKRSLMRHVTGAVCNVFRRGHRGELVSLCVPAALYSVQNTLLYTALSNLSAQVYQTTYQLKLVTTAAFSIVLFRTRVSPRQWAALVLLTLGVATVQLSSSSTSTSTSTLDSLASGDEMNPTKGFVAIFLACVSSGFAGAWFEKVVKSKTSRLRSQSVTASATEDDEPENSVRIGRPSIRNEGADPRRVVPRRPRRPPSASSSTTMTEQEEDGESLWHKNLQLAFPSLVFASLGVYLASLSSRSSSMTRGEEGPTSTRGFLGGNGNGYGFDAVLSLWTGFTPIVWFVVLNQAFGGLLVAVVVKEASSIDKGFATSFAIVLSTLASFVLDLERQGGQQQQQQQQPGFTDPFESSKKMPSRGFVTGAAMVIGSTVLYSL